MATTRTVSFGSIPRIAIMFAIIMSALAASLTAPSVSAQTDSSCHAYKANTGNETDSGGKNRLEVGGSQPQMIDFYPAEGVLAVSYVLPTQDDVFIWWGYGSVWEYPNCDLDYVRQQTEGYITGNDRSIARTDHGHSGVMFDMSTGQVTNFGDLTDDEVEALLEVHRTGLAGEMDTDGDGNGEGTNQPTTCASTETAYGGLQGCMPETGDNVDEDNLRNDSDSDEDGATTSGQQANCDVESVQHDPATGPLNFTVEDGGVAYLQFWTNAPGVEQAEHRVLITEAGDYSIDGGGTYFVFPSGCADEAQAMFDDDNRPEWTLEDLDGFGLVN